MDIGDYMQLKKGMEFELQTFTSLDKGTQPFVVCDG